MTNTQIIILLIGIALSGIIALNNAFGLRDRYGTWKKEKEYPKRGMGKSCLSLELDKRFKSKNLNDLEFVIDEYYRHLDEGGNLLSILELMSMTHLFQILKEKKRNPNLIEKNY